MQNYVILQTGGKQYQATAGSVLRIEQLPTEQGKDIKLDSILMAVDAEKTVVGSPYLKNSFVECHVLGHDKHKKVIIYKHKRRKSYQKMTGHRQPYTAVYVKNAVIEGKTFFEAPLVEKKKTVEGKQLSKDSGVEVKSEVIEKKNTINKSAQKTPIKKSASSKTQETKTSKKEATSKTKVTKSKTK